MYYYDAIYSYSAIYIYSAIYSYSAPVEWAEMSTVESGESGALQQTHIGAVICAL